MNVILVSEKGRLFSFMAFDTKKSLCNVWCTHMRTIFHAPPDTFVKCLLACPSIPAGSNRQILLLRRIMVPHIYRSPVLVLIAPIEISIHLFCSSLKSNENLLLTHT